MKLHFMTAISASAVLCCFSDWLPFVVWAALANSRDQVSTSVNVTP